MLVKRASLCMIAQSGKTTEEFAVYESPAVMGSHIMTTLLILQYTIRELWENIELRIVQTFIATDRDNEMPSDVWTLETRAVIFPCGGGSWHVGSKHRRMHRKRLMFWNSFLSCHSAEGVLARGARGYDRQNHSSQNDLAVTDQNED